MSNTRQTVKLLLDESQALLKDNHIIPHHYASVVEAMLLVELQREIVKLNVMLETPEQFREKFQQRCSERAQDTESCIPFDIMLESPTNRLYLQIATLVFSPKNMQELLAILMPTIKWMLRPTFNEAFPLFSDGAKSAEFIKHIRKWLPHHDAMSALEKLPIDVTALEPTYEAFSSLVTNNDTLLNIADIAYFNLHHHLSFEHHITAHPELHKCLYTHNSETRTLLADLQLFRSEQTTPRCALLALIKALILGGSSVTNSNIASTSAVIAVSQFSEYVNALPESTQESLCALRSNSKTLSDIMEKDIGAGHCVETTATHLKSLLDNHPSPHAILDSPPTISQSALIAIQRKYALAFRGIRKLDTRKDDSNCQVFPKKLIAIVIGRIIIKSSDELALLLLAFPTFFYDMFWQNVKFDMDVKKRFSHLATLIADGFFQEDQLKALAHALFKHYSRFALQSNIFDWTRTTRNPIFVNHLISQLSSDADYALLYLNNGVLDLYRFFAADPAMRKIDSMMITRAIKTLSPEKRFHAIAGSLTSTFGESALNNRSNDVESITLLLSLLTPAQRLEAVKLSNYRRLPLLLQFSDHPLIVTAILNQIDAEVRRDYLLGIIVTSIRPVTRTFITHYLVRRPASLTAVLMSVSPSVRADLVLARDDDGNSAYDLATYHPESLLVLLSIDYGPSTAAIKSHILDNIHKIDYSSLLPALTFCDLTIDKVAAQLENFKLKKQLLRLAIQANDGLTVAKILSLTNTRLALESLFMCNSRLDMQLFLTAETSAHLPIYEKLAMLLKLLPKDDCFFLLTTGEASSASTPLKIALNHTPLLRLMLNALSLAQRLQAITMGGDTRAPLLKMTTLTPAITGILESIPMMKCLDVVLLPDPESGDTAAHVFVSKPAAIAALLEPIPKHLRWRVVSAKNNRHESVLSCALKYPETLRVMLTMLPQEIRVDVILHDPTLMLRCVKAPEATTIIFNLLLPAGCLKALQAPVFQQQINTESANTILYAILLPLTEKQIFELLRAKMTADSTVATYFGRFMAENNLQYSEYYSYPACTHESFSYQALIDLLNVYGYLRRVTDKTKNKTRHAALFSNHECEKLLSDLHSANNFETFKNKILTYLNSPKITTVMQGVLSCLVGQFNEEDEFKLRLTKLEKHWTSTDQQTSPSMLKASM